MLALLFAYYLGSWNLISRYWIFPQVSKSLESSPSYPVKNRLLGFQILFSPIKPKTSNIF